MENNYFIILDYIIFYIYFDGSPFDDTWFSFTLFSCLKECFISYILLQYSLYIDVVLTLSIGSGNESGLNHRPHSRQVTGALCTGGRGSPVMSWILLKANNAQQTSGVGDKIYSHFKRNVQHLWTAIKRHHVNDITHKQVMRFNQWSKFANIFLVHLKNLQCFGTLAQPFQFLPNTPVMTQWVLTGPARVEWLWVNDFSHNEYHIWQAWPSTCWHVGSKLPKYEVPVFIAQTRNYWRKWIDCASVPKNGLLNWCD